MFKKNNLIGLGVLLLVLAPSAYAGKVELTTYYPSPYGEYTTLSANTVGIGTTGPQAKLHVLIPARSAAFGAATGSTWHDLIIQNQDNTQDASVGLVFELNSSYHGNAGTGIAAVKSTASSDYGADLVFITRPQAAVAQERMRILSSGNVGIGTTNPAIARLQAETTSGVSFITGATGYSSASYFSTDGIPGWGASYNYAGDDGAFVANRVGYQAGTSYFRDFIVYNGKNSEVFRVDGSSDSVGIGTTAPQSRFVVKSPDAGYNAGLFLAGTTAFSILPHQGIVYLSAGTYYQNTTWLYYQNAGASLLGISETAGAVWYSGTGASYSNVASNVSLWNAAGTWIGSSSRTLKENFTKLNPDELLNKIDQLDISRWNFKSEGKSTTHIGPVAEDFYRIFNTGDQEKHLATIDTAGVSLAGVKALYDKVKSQEQQMEKLQKQIDELNLQVNRKS